MDAECCDTNGRMQQAYVRNGKRLDRDSTNP